MNKDLLKRYFENTCSSEERNKVADWLSDPSHREEVMSFMEGEWEQWQPTEDELDAAVKEMNLSFGEVKGRTKVFSLFSGGSRVRRVVSGVAAGLLFLVAGAGIGYYYHGNVRSQPQPQNGLYYASAQTLRGQRSKLVLSDGSEIYLNAESRLSISHESSARSVVYLEGEAFFKVPDKEKPLIVKTADIVATTKGSHFNISAFPRDGKVTVSVENGKTDITPNNEKTMPLMALRIPRRDSTMRKDSAGGKEVLTPTPATMPLMALRRVTVKANESVTYDRANKQTAAPQKLNEEELRSWKEGFIYFNHPDSAGLVDKLERWFDVNVTLNAGGLPLKKMNCGLKNATLIEVLDHVGRDLELEYRIEGKHVYLSRRVK